MMVCRATALRGGTALLVALCLAACGGMQGPGDPVSDPPPAGSGLTPLTELAPARYEGLAGGLYPGGLNAPPADNYGAPRLVRFEVEFRF